MIFLYVVVLYSPRDWSSDGLFTVLTDLIRLNEGWPQDVYKRQVYDSILMVLRVFTLLLLYLLCNFVINSSFFKLVFGIGGKFN